MAKVIVVMGQSGSGKTASLRNVEPSSALVLQVVKKELPFKSQAWTPFVSSTGEGSVAATDSYGKVRFGVVAGIKAGKKVIVIDDAQYLLAGEFMARSSEVGFQKFTDIAKNVWDMILDLQNVEGDARIYLIWHTETLDTGHVKMKTIGKLLDEKITLEGLFTIILKAYADADGYHFATSSNGLDSVKTPMGMFKERIIDNDLKEVDTAICEYYGI